MNSREICFLPITTVAKLLQSRELSSVELVNAYIERVDAVEGTVNAYITVTRDEARVAARAVEEEIRRGQYRGPLHGVPISVKDLFQTKGIRTTSGTEVMAEFVPSEDATVVARLKKAGAVFLGKLGMNELALGATGENPHYGDTVNPWDPKCISGGSSGGSAAATAAGECAAALGSDTGGSVRIPSALCGVVGLKPTYGLVSLRGVTPLCRSLDHVGVMARTVEDCALVLGAIAGYDPEDTTSVDALAPDVAAGLRDGVKSLRIGVPGEHARDVLSSSVRDAVRQAVGVLAGLGASVVEVPASLLSDSVDIALPIMRAESLAAHGELLRAHGSRLDPKVKQRLEAGLTVSAVDYIRAQQARAALTRGIRNAMHQVDLLALPVCTVVAFERGASEVDVDGRKVSAIDALTRLTRFSNLTGQPALSIPCGFSSDGLPIGIQLVGRPFEEATVLRAAYAYEQATDWHQRHPRL